ncbi:hypothetical protein, partial [Liquorilactobacillus sicerae]|uniref:hypothetical protein n=1 Tax=Liquorilactobacillus sicerae TaxID=1416943 RepID=UPI003D009A46
LNFLKDASINQKVSFDLHVLGTPPAFVLSQDQTLILKFVTQIITSELTSQMLSFFKALHICLSKLCSVFKGLLAYCPQSFIQRRNALL